MSYSDFLKDCYVRGRIDLDNFERRVEEALALGIAEWPSDRAVRMLVDRLNARSRVTRARYDRLVAQIEGRLPRAEISRTLSA